MPQQEPSSPRPQPRPQPKPDPKVMGYTGNTCMTCGGVRMVRTGTCERCEECYSTSGCS